MASVAQKPAKAVRIPQQRNRKNFFCMFRLQSGFRGIQHACGRTQCHQRGLLNSTLDNGVAVSVSHWQETNIGPLNQNLNKGVATAHEKSHLQLSLQVAFVFRTVQRCLAATEVDTGSVTSSNLEAEGVGVADRHRSAELLAVVAAVQCE